MTAAGIERLSFYGGQACVDVRELAAHRGLDIKRFDNLMMQEKTVALPHEDPVTYAVNAARPIIETLTAEDQESIELLITCTESGIDFGKSLSTYVHEHLGLKRHCRMFEVKQACYSGTAGLQTAVNFIASRTSPGARALVICTDLSRFLLIGDGEAMSMDWAFAEPSGGAGAVAMLIGEQPGVFAVDLGASGYYGYEVMDTCRPVPDSEAGDADLSLMSYLDCCEQTFAAYEQRVESDYRRSFQYLAFHVPFGGMVKGAHRKMMRRFGRSSPAEIDLDFEQRVLPGLQYGQRVGNIMGGSLYLALAGLIDSGQFETPKRIGCFSYGSGCASEFFSGVVTPAGQRSQHQLRLADSLALRRKLTMAEYDAILADGHTVKFGTRNVTLPPGHIGMGRDGDSHRYLALKEIKQFHRIYEWQ